MQLTSVKALMPSLNFVTPECADGIDNDMDGATDYPNDELCTYAGDNSEAASCLLYSEPLRVVSMTEEFTVDTTGVGNNYTNNGSARGNEVPFVLLLEQASNVDITITASHDTYLHMRANVCDDQETYEFNDDIVVLDNTNSQLTLVNVPAGIYFVFVDGWGSDDNGQTSVSVTIN